MGLKVCISTDINVSDYFFASSHCPVFDHFQYARVDQKTGQWEGLGMGLVQFVYSLVPRPLHQLSCMCKQSVPGLSSLGTIKAKFV